MSAPEQRGPGFLRMKRNLPDPEALRLQTLAMQQRALKDAAKRRQRLLARREGKA